jgi:predicted metalloprotease
MNVKHLARVATASATVVLSLATSAGLAEADDSSSVQQVGTTTTFVESRLGFPTDSMPGYLKASIADVDATWVRMFAGWGYATVPAAYVVFPAPGESVLSCGAASKDTTMEYCPSTDTITFSQEAATRLWQGDVNGRHADGSGAMSVSLLLAHEYGHNIESELGLLGDGSLHDNAADERGADCFAGVWAQDAAARGMLSDADVSAAYAGLDLAAEHPEVGVSDNGIHGTTQDRQQAYEIGAEQGAKACVDTYLSAQGS